MNFSCTVYPQRSEGSGRTVRTAGTLSCSTPLARWRRAWLGRFRRCGSAGVEHDSRSEMGGSLLADLRHRHHRWNDADYRRTRAAVFLHRLQMPVADSRTRGGIRSAQPGLRTLRLLPDRVYRRPVHQPSQLGTQLTLAQALESSNNSFRRSVSPSHAFFRGC